MIWLYTYQAATACSNALVGAFAARQCSQWQFWHMLGMLAFFGGIAVVLISVAVRVKQ